MSRNALSPRLPTFLTENMAFVHVPKTGGSWVMDAVKAAGIDVCGPPPHEGGDDSVHAHVCLSQADAGERLSVAFVRHPLDWWRSYWGHRMRAGWVQSSPIDELASTDFNEFVSRVLARYPGYFDGLVAGLVGDRTSSVDFIGRFEHLREDTLRALQLSGERFSSERLMSHPRQNVNDYARHPAAYRPEVALRLAASEHRTIERFYRHDPIPAPLLIGAGGDRRAAAGAIASDLTHQESYVQALERALHRAQSNEQRLERALIGAQEEIGAATGSLHALRRSRLVRYTRPARVGYYRARRARTRLSGHI